MKNKWRQCVALMAVACMALSASALASTINRREVEFAPDVIIPDEDKTYAMIDEYVQKIEARNAEIATCNLENINATITFSDYLSFEEFEEFVEQYELEVVQLHARGLQNDGTRLSIFSKVDMGLDKTAQLLLGEAEYSGFTFVGITGMNTCVSSAQLAAIGADARTYLADTSALDSAAIMSVNAEEVCTTNESTWFPHTLTWDLENLGILD